MDSYIIQVQPQDELTVLIDKLIHTQAERVYLLIPDNSRIAQHILNFRLLKREADSLHKEIVVVSSSPRVQNLALKSQLQAHQETHELKERAAKYTDARTSHPKLSDIMIPPKIVDEKEEKKKSEKIKMFFTRRPHVKLPSLPQKSPFSIPAVSIPSARINLSNATVFKAILFSLIGISSIILVITFYFVLPKSSISIKPIVEPVAITVSVKADVDAVNIGAGGAAGEFIVPAQIFEKSLEVSKSAPATGEKEIKEKARGTIKVYNSYSSSPQTLVKTTRFVSEGGKLFRTLQSVVVPGAEIEDGKIVPSLTTVDIVAAEPGSEYNIGPSTFSIPGLKGTPKYLAFYGKSESDMKGGEIGVARIIKEDDFKNLQEQIKQELMLKIDESVNVSIPKGFFIPDGAKDTSEISFNASGNIGDTANTLTITANVSTRAFAVRKADIEFLIAEDFKLRFPRKRLLGGYDNIAFEVIDAGFKDGTLRIKSSLSASAATVIENQNIIEDIRGKSEDDVRSFLSSHPDIAEAKVTFWPFWANKIPDDANKIYITIE